MSDQNLEPGAPTPAEAAVAPAKKLSPSADVPAVVNDAHTFMLRLNKLLATPGGLNTFLSTTNYTLYLIAYIGTKTPSPERIAQLLGRLVGIGRHAKPSRVVAGAAAPVSPALALAGMLTSARTTLRLVGCVPLYVALTGLLTKKDKGDPVLYRISVTQVLSYFAFQALENVAVLADKDVIPKDVLARFTRVPLPRIFLWSYRAWLAGIVCDLFRLAREAQISREQRGERVRLTKEEEAADNKWWGDLVASCGWLPFAAHCAIEGGLPGFNLGVMGVCGLVAGYRRQSQLWAATKA